MTAVQAPNSICGVEFQAKCKIRPEPLLYGFKVASGFMFAIAGLLGRKSRENLKHITFFPNADIAPIEILP